MDWILGISNQFDTCHIKLLSKITERGEKKLFPSESMETRLGRSRESKVYQFSWYFAFLMNTNQHLYPSVPDIQAEYIAMTKDLVNHSTYWYTIPSNVVAIENAKAHLPSSMDAKLGRSKCGNNL